MRHQPCRRRRIGDHQQKQRDSGSSIQLLAQYQQEACRCFGKPTYILKLDSSRRFRVRLNCVDHYQAPPSGFDPPLFGHHGSTQQRNSPTVPVIRVFGSTETGQKVCAHIHGALPYLFIEYKGSLDQEAVDAYIHQLRSSIDHALAVSYRRNLYDGKAVFVGHVTLVKGVPFFGYHVGYRFFLKIYLLNPLHMTRFADLLYQGAIMNQVFQPFEAHLQYLLQWMCDFNLYGCAYIECDKFKFRGPVPDYMEMSSEKHRWHSSSIPSAFISDLADYPRRSHCSLELDICVQDILNRLDIDLRDLHANFVERFPQMNPDEKLLHSLAGLWRDETRRRKRRMGCSDDSNSPFPPEVLLSMSADPRAGDKAGWIHEDEYRERVLRLVQEERSKVQGPQPAFDDFVKPCPGESDVQTVLQSVEDLFLEKLVPQTPAAVNRSEDEPAMTDDSKIPFLDDEDFPYDSDEDAARELALSQTRPVKTMADAARDHLLKHSNKAVSPDDQGPINDPLAAADEIIGQASVPSENKNLKRSLGNGEASLAAPGVPVSDSTKRLKTLLSERRSQDNLPADEAALSKHADSQKDDKAAPPSTTLSQTSIKASDQKASASFSFPLAKTPHGSQTASSQGNQATVVSPSKFRGQKPSQIPRAPKMPSTKSTISPDTVSPFSASDCPSQTMTSIASNYETSAGLPPMTKACVIGLAPPSSADVSKSLFDLGYHPVIYQDAYYSDEKDVPERARDYAGREFKLESTSLPFLPAFDASGTSPASVGEKPPVIVDYAKEDISGQKRSMRCRLRNWEIADAPPRWLDVEQWLENEAAGKNRENENAVKNSLGAGAEESRPMLSQIDGPTQHGQHGFKFSQRQDSTSVRHETQYMSVMSLEVHVNTREHFVPNPEFDEISCIFWCTKSDEDDGATSSSGSNIDGFRVGVVCVSESAKVGKSMAQEAGVEVEVERSELDLINRMVDIVREYDPDVLTGFEVHNGSWGYIIERARIKYEFDLCDEFSRMMSQSHGRFGKDADRWGFNTTSTIRVTGRHMINVWRSMRSEINLLQYSLENIAFHLLHRRMPHYPFKVLTAWYTSGVSRDLSKVIRYYLSRTRANLEILDAQELIPRTSEQARLIGVDFFSVFSRGSQYKVESFMFRIAKPENFLLVSPSRKQVGQQNALECLPLVMEPQSAFYTSPLLVLDFQSLYPSIMIAYNYCYSTCLGRTVSWRGSNKLGFADFARQPGLLELVKDDINIAPNGMMYVKQSMRKSLLAKMLSEILETRVMVKSGMKMDKQDKTLQQLLNNRQLALKLLANVTYGYSSASFSGRMPCSEIADSIVQTARETLEKSIAFIHSVERWGAEVVYGDTDSLFVYLKGRTRDEAFRIGNEIAAEITNRNPRPVKLKFEKVYHPCVLLAKKRYVGFKYESPSQQVPDFDAKGIETVRRDGNPAEQKIEEKALKLLFRTADLSQVKRYFLRQCTKIMTGKVSIQDFCFAREVKLGTYSDKGPPPPGALISTRRMLADPRTEPQYGERVPYVVATGAPGARLIDRCMAPEQLLQDESAELDAEYYITKTLIPPLERIFNLVGANVRQWFDDMPKVQRVRDVPIAPAVGQYAPNGQAIAPRKTLEGYMRLSHCAVCRAKLTIPAADGAVVSLCEDCMGDRPRALFALLSREREAQGKVADIERVCRNCAALAWGERVRCDSKDCPVFYSRIKARAQERKARGIAEGAVSLLEGEDETHESDGLD